MKSKLEIYREYRSGQSYGTSFGMVQMMVRFIRNGHDLNSIAGEYSQLKEVARDCARFTS